VRGCDVRGIGEQTTKNARAVFGLNG